MRSLVSSAALLSLSLVHSVHAHLCLTNIYLDDTTPGDATCLRYNRDPNKRNFPVEDLSSDAMACGFDGTKPVSRICPADAGDKLTLGWGTFREERPTEYLAASHQGPCSVMMKKVNSANEDSGVGDGWFSIFYEGYNNATGKWCTERMMDNGKISVEIPNDLAPGDYLIRSELLAMHSAAVPDKPDPQFYISCAQVFLKSTGSAVPKDTVSIPSGYVNMQMPAMTYNIYLGPEHNAAYPDYGPPVYKSSGQSNGKGNQVQTKGLKKEGCVLEDGDWCGVEVPKYTDEHGCWESSKACWAQSMPCWKTSMGQSGCKAWDEKCKAIGKDCENRNFNGPPNHGQEVKHAGGARKATCPNVIQGGSPGNAKSSGQTYERGEDSAPKETPSSTSSAEGQKPTESTAEIKPESTSKPEATSTSESKPESASSQGEQKPEVTSTSETKPDESSSQEEQKSEEASAASTEAPAGSCTATVTDVVYETVTTTVNAEASAASGASADLYRHRMRARHMH